MAWKHQDDEPQRRTARDLQRHVGSTWLVFWGPASRCFWAFRRGGCEALRLSASDPNQLYSQIARHTPMNRRGGVVNPPRTSGESIRPLTRSSRTAAPSNRTA